LQFAVLLQYDQFPMSHPAITRRQALRAAAGFILVRDAIAASSDFWTKKPPAEWSADEIKQLRTKSPWAKKLRAEMSGGGPAVMGNGRGADSGAVPDAGRGPNLNAAGLPGRGMVGDDDAPPGGRGGAEAPEFIVRWESAQPLMALEKEPFPHELLGRYVISVTGLTPQMLQLGIGRGGPPQQNVDPRRTVAEQIFSQTTLTIKGHDPQHAIAMMRTVDMQTYLFGFPRENLPIAPSDKEALFTLKLGPLTIKAKFELKEMMFAGQLAV
jgi:hypothetical protein